MRDPRAICTSVRPMVWPATCLSSSDSRKTTIILDMILLELNFYLMVPLYRTWFSILLCGGGIVLTDIL